jgi:hypothetical protein
MVERVLTATQAKKLDLKAKEKFGIPAGQFVMRF